jgi:hypothetical protein
MGPVFRVCDGVEAIHPRFGCESCCEANLNLVLRLPDHEANDRIASVKKTLELLALASVCYTIAPRLRPSYR